MSKTMTILEYKRETDSWLCSDCDAENEISLGRCVVCGNKKAVSATILKKWTEEDNVLPDVPGNIPPYIPPYIPPSFPGISPETEETDIESGNSNVGLWILIAVVVFVLIALGIIVEGKTPDCCDIFSGYDTGIYMNAANELKELPEESDYNLSVGDYIGDISGDFWEVKE